GGGGGERKERFRVVGHGVTRAPRLKDAANTGAIWVGPQTYRYTKDEFEYRDLHPLTLKGKARPVPTYELLSVKERIHRPRPLAGDRMIFSDLVGRQRELEQLQHCLTQVRTGHGGIVGIGGEAGLGKSRLAAEVLPPAGVPGVMVLEGRSLSVGQGLSFHPFVDLLRHWAGIADDAPEA